MKRNYNEILADLKKHGDLELQKVLFEINSDIDDVDVKIKTSSTEQAKFYEKSKRFLILAKEKIEKELEKRKDPNYLNPPPKHPKHLIIKF